MKYKTVRDVELKNRRVLMRVDFNVPLTQQGKVSDETRIIAALPTIKYVLDHGGRLILMSHLGRPKSKDDNKCTLEPVVGVLSKKLGKSVKFLKDCIGGDVKIAVQDLKPGEVLLLENLRFHKEEEANDPQFAEELASLGDVYVNDAFGTAHRAHASTAGVAAFMQEKVAGLLMERELDFLGEKTRNPKRPFVVILGGAKVSDKIEVINALLDKADKMLIGGAMAYTFMLAMGFETGDSLVEKDKVDLAKACMEKAREKGVEFLCPVDHLVAEHVDFKEGFLEDTKIVEGSIGKGFQGVDIGPKTVELYAGEVADAATILWNGPMGIFEIDESAEGTYAIAKAVAESKGESIIGGGDSVKALNQSGFADDVTFISTGGGASLEFLEGKELPGVICLDKVE